MCPRARTLVDDAAPFAHVRSHDPRDVLAEVSARGGTSLLVEGGAQVSAAFFGRVLSTRRGLCRATRAWWRRQVLGISVCRRWRVRFELEFDDVTPLGPDIRISGRPRTE